MKYGIVPVVVLMLAGCSTSEVRPEVAAVRDLIALEQPPQVDQIRLLNQLYYQYLNDYYVTVTQGRRLYLVEFSARCRALRRSEYTPSMVDTRRHAKQINAKWDTIRGCPIDRIFTLSAAQLEEIRELNEGSFASGR